MSTEAKNQNGSVIPTPGSQGNVTTAYTENGTQNDKKVAPVMDSDILNNALLAARNPQAALLKIRNLTRDAKQAIRNGNTPEAFTALNQINSLTGALS